MKTYIIAEIGINHNNNLENCFKLIDSAADAGCHAAKFQLFFAKHLYPKDAGMIDWKDGEASYSYDIFNAAKKLELPTGWLDQIIAYCKERNIDFLSSVFDLHGLALLIKKGIKSVKLSSYTITNLPLIEAAANAGLTVFQSTGAARLGETEDAVKIFNGCQNNSLTLLHCSAQYPTKLPDCNLGVIKTLQLAFPHFKIGYSDHTAEVSTAPVQAVLLGAGVIEKHITLDKKMDGPDHFFALNPHELAEMVNDIRDAEKRLEQGNFSIDKTLLGSSVRKCYDHEEYLRNFCFMTLFAGKNIQKGTYICKEDIKILRPGKRQPGLLPKYLELFKQYKITAKQNIQINDPITWESIL